MRGGLPLAFHIHHPSPDGTWRTERIVHRHRSDRVTRIHVALSKTFGAAIRAADRDAETLASVRLLGVERHG